MSAQAWTKALPVSKTKVDQDGLSIDTLQRWLDEISDQPNWRRNADREADYYDGNQLDADTLADMEERNLPPLITNLIKPTVDVILGMEARTRTDWKVRPEASDASDDVAEAMSEKLHQAEITSRADRACSDAYAHQIKVGLGWVEVARNSDPFQPPYRVRAIHRREMFWDWRAKEPDLSDARYIVRKKWVDIDVLANAFPDKAEILRQSAMGWQNWDIFFANNSELARAWDIERGFSIEDFEWINHSRRRVVFYEVWYRQLTKGLIIKKATGETDIFDESNPLHLAEMQNGNMPVQAMYMAMRLALYAGPHLLKDLPSPHRHQMYHYVPFFGFREDLTGIPYGVIRTMLSPQDEVNAKKAKMQWMLSARRVIADSDVVLDHVATANEIARPDCYIQLNPKRAPNSRFEIEEPGALNAQQFQLLQEAKDEINQSAGIYQTMMGADSQAKSGLAINSLVEQGTTTLGEINDNYRHSRRLVGELLCELVKEDLEGQINIPVQVNQGHKKKTIMLNAPAQDQQTGAFVLQNNISAVRCAVVLDDVPQTPTYRNQQLSQLSELVKSLPPQLQAVLIPFVVEATDIPNRFEMSDLLNKIQGLGEGEQDPEKEAMKLQLMQLQQQLEQAVNDPRIREVEAKIKKLEADATLNNMRATVIVDKLAKGVDSEDEDQAEQKQGTDNPNEERNEYRD